MKFEVTFKDVIGEVDCEDDAYGVLLSYLKECVAMGDVTAFDFKRLEDGRKTN